MCWRPGRRVSGSSCRCAGRRATCSTSTRRDTPSRGWRESPSWWSSSSGKTSSTTRRSAYPRSEDGNTRYKRRTKYFHDDKYFHFRQRTAGCVSTPVTSSRSPRRWSERWTPSTTGERWRPSTWATGLDTSSSCSSSSGRTSGRENGGNVQNLTFNADTS